MSREINILKNYLLYLLTGVLIIFIGLSNVFADTTIDSANWINVTGQKWSETGFLYTGSPSYNSDWLLNAYEITPGYMVNNYEDWNYIEYSFFEHSGSSFDPCNSTAKFTADFSLLFTTPGIVDQVLNVKWGTENCSMTYRSSQTGQIDLSCIASPTSGNQTDIYVYYSDGIFPSNASYVYISRDIDISCGLNTDSIINNNNANTQNIINNNNSNTQDIINNQNQNNQEMIDSQKACTPIDKTDIVESAKAFNSNGTIIDGGNWGITDYIDINNAEIEVLTQWTSATSTYSCYYKSDKTLISCFNNRNISITIPSNARYVRFSINASSNLPTFNICKNGNQALNDSINSLDTTLNDDDTSGATSEASDFFDSFSTDTFGLTSIITSPLTVIQSILSSSCTALRVPLPYVNRDLTIPCMTPVYGEMAYRWLLIYQDITYGIIAYWVCVRIFNMVKDFKNPEHDEIEVLDL